MSAFEDSPVPLGHGKYWSTSEVAKRRLQRQMKWSSSTISGYDSRERWYQENPQHRPKDWPSPAKRKQYEAACRMEMERILTK